MIAALSSAMISLGGGLRSPGHASKRYTDRRRLARGRSKFSAPLRAGISVTADWSSGYCGAEEVVGRDIQWNECLFVAGQMIGIELEDQPGHDLHALLPQGLFCGRSPQSPTIIYRYYSLSWSEQQQFERFTSDTIIAVVNNSCGQSFAPRRVNRDPILPHIHRIQGT